MQNEHMRKLLDIVNEAQQSFMLELSEIENPNYSEDQDNFYIDIGVNYEVSGSYHAATQYEPEEHPELEITDIVDLATGQQVDITDQKTLDYIQDQCWKQMEASRDDYDDFDDFDDTRY